MKAVFVTGGKQYYVTEGDTIYVEKLDAEVGKDVELDFENNVNAGDEAVITVVGKGVGYTGKKSFNFTILPADIAEDVASVQCFQPVIPHFGDSQDQLLDLLLPAALQRFPQAEFQEFGGHLIGPVLRIIPALLQHFGP